MSRSEDNIPSRDAIIDKLSSNLAKGMSHGFK